MRSLVGPSLILALSVSMTGCWTTGLLFPPMDDDDSAGDDDDDDSTESFDCATAPAAPVSQRVIEGPRGYHGLAFDDDGLVVGSDGLSLVKSTYEGAASVFVPNAGYREQMVYLPSGDLIAFSGETGDLERFTPEGGRETLAAGLGGYGVVVGPDGMLYTAGWGRISRVDPSTGAVQPFGVWSADDEPHSLAFSRDGRALYIGTIASGWGSGGQSPLYVLDVDEQVQPVGAPRVLGDVGDGWLDGVAVDVCGVMYLPDYASSKLYRVQPDGFAEVYYDWSGDQSQYGHAVVWGNGIGGWREDALYLPMPYDGNKVQEIVVGVPSAAWVGAPLNAP